MRKLLGAAVLIAPLALAPTTSTVRLSALITSVAGVSTNGPITTGTSDMEFEVVAGVGAVFYPQTAAEATAGVTPTNYFRKPGDIRRYGTIMGSGGADTSIVQATINQAMQPTGVPWRIPRGVTASVRTSGSIRGPVGTALTISSRSVGYIEGALVGANNGHVIRVTGDDVTVKLTGSITGYGKFFTGPDGHNGALFFNDGGDNVKFIGTGKLINPPQYAVRYDGATATGGRIGAFQIIGGPTSLGGNEQHYGVRINGPFTGLFIDSFTTEPNASGGAVGQGLVGASTLGRPTGIVVASPSFRGTLDHSVYFFANYSSFGRITAIDCSTTVKIGGIGNSIAGITSSNPHSGDGGVAFQSLSKSSVGPVTVTGYGNVGFSLQPRSGEATDGVISRNTFGPITVIGRASDTNVRTAFRILGIESSGSTETSQSDIVVESLVIKDAAQSPTVEGAIQFHVGSGKTMSRVRIRKAVVNTTGWYGVEWRGSGAFVDFELDDVLIRNAGSASGATDSQTRAFRVASGTTLINSVLNTHRAGRP